MTEPTRPPAPVLPLTRMSQTRTPQAIELRHLRALAAVGVELHFGRAAGLLHLSQPALSRQISQLERLVGCPLLHRSTHRVELTLAGAALLESAQSLLDDLDDALARTRAVAGSLTARADSLWRPFVQRSAGDADVHELRAAYEAFGAQMPVPPDTVVRPVTAGGVPSLLVAPDDRAGPTVLFLHGGGYVMGSAFGYRPLTGAVAASTGRGVLVPDYRLAPEHPYPAAVDDALAVYEWLLDQGVEPRRITVAGDSAGAGLAVSLLLRAGRRGLPRPGCAVLLCPWLDAGRAVDGGDSPTASPQERILRHSATYLPDPRTDAPETRPLDADLGTLPPTLVQIGERDALAAQSERFVARARAHGVDARFDAHPVATHVFHLFWSFLPEAADALERIGEFVGTHTDADRATG